MGGLVTTPTSWYSGVSTSPPVQYQAVMADGRYWWADPPGGSFDSLGPIQNNGPLPPTAIMTIAWAITTPTNGGGHDDILVSITNDAGTVDTNIGQAIASGTIPFDLTGSTFVHVNVHGSGLGPAPHPYGAVVALGITASVPPSGPNGHGDIPNPEAWAPV